MSLIPRAISTIALTYGTFQTAALSMMYITAVSGVLIQTGIIIHNFAEVFPGGSVPDYYKVQFAGGFLTTFFWVYYKYRAKV